jgi:hypothetical protein
LFKIAAGSHQPSTSPLITTPFPLCKRMALLDPSNMNQFKGDPVCELVGGVQWYGNVTGACMEDKETKLFFISLLAILLHGLLSISSKIGLITGEEKHQPAVYHRIGWMVSSLVTVRLCMV